MSNKRRKRPHDANQEDSLSQPPLKKCKKNERKLTPKQLAANKRKRNAARCSRTKPKLTAEQLAANKRKRNASRCRRTKPKVTQNQRMQNKRQRNATRCSRTKPKLTAEQLAVNKRERNASRCRQTKTKLTPNQTMENKRKQNASRCRRTKPKLTAQELAVNKRKRNVARAGTKQLTNEQQFDFWNATAYPSNTEFRERRLNDVGVAIALTRAMCDNWVDVRKKPSKLDFEVDVAEILEEWKKEMGHQSPLRVCACCGRQTIMTEKEFKSLPFHHSYLECFKAKDLPEKNSLKYKAMHLFAIDDQVFHFSKRGIQDDNVIVCKPCFGNLEYANKTKKPPINTFAHYDMGKIHPDLQPLNYGEKLAISKVLVYFPEIQFKAVHGARAKGIKGHAFGIKMSQGDVLSSVVQRLPRRDLGEVIKLSVVGKKEVLPLALKIIKQTQLTIRADVIVAWLVWLKALGNPNLMEVEIPNQHDKAEMADVQKMLEESVQQILDNASICESGLVDEMMNHVRSEMLDEADDINEEIEDDLIRNVWITDEASPDEPMHEILKKIQKQMTSFADSQVLDEPIEVRIENELINEYTNNHTLLSCAFPFIFPFGLTENVLNAKVRPLMRRTWMLFYDQRFARDPILKFLLFDQTRRLDANESVSMRIKRGGEREQDFIEQVNDPNFAANLESAIKNPDAKAARSLKRKLEPLVKMSGRNLPWSIFERGDTLGTVYAYSHFFGIPNWFVTLSPSMRHNFLALRVALGNQEESFEIPDVIVRSRQMIDNPVAAVEIFHRMLEKFFDIIVQIPLTDWSGKNINVDNFIRRRNSSTCGAFGPVKAAVGVLEEQTSGNLHFHGLLFGAWDVRQIQQWCHDPELRRKFEALIDAHITCSIPLKFKAESARREELKLDAPYPDELELPEDAAKYAAKFNHHIHKFTCWKNNNQKCRMAMRQPQTQNTFIAEIIADEDGNPVKKRKISMPPQRKKNEHAFSVTDQRIIVHRLARCDEFEQLQVEQNPPSTSCWRCNSSIQVLLSGTQAKAATYYCADYMSKDPYQLQSILPLMLQAEQEHQKWGSKAADAEAPSRKAKNILQKVLNKCGVIEVSDQQATAAVMGFDSAVGTHTVGWVFPWQAIRYLHDMHSEPDDMVTLSIMEIDESTGTALDVSEFDRYLARGEKLQNLNLYDYSMIIDSHHWKQKKKVKTTNVGRPSNATFSFVDGSEAAKTKQDQIIRSVPRIPRLGGNQTPPTYPGNIPTDPKLLIAWKSEAKIFVEFYSLLFLPLNENGLPIPLYEGILPWKGVSSWERFWKVFTSFEDSTAFYQRSIWCIFRNMVDNMRNNHASKTLIQKWRFLAADERSSADNQHATCEDSVQRAETHDNESDEVKNDLAEIAEQLRARYGAQKFLAPHEEERRKAQIYIQQQISMYRAMQHVDTQSSTSITFPHFTYDQCVNLSKNVHKNQPLHVLALDEEIETESDDWDIVQKQVNETFEIRQQQTEIKDLKPHQLEAIEKLKQFKRDKNMDPMMKEGQLLAFMQGIPGAGKTTTAKHLADKLGLRILCSGTTSTAAAELHAETINSLLGLGRNINDSKKEKKMTYNQKTRLQDLFRDIDLLVIDEISMMTAVTLERIDKRLRVAKNQEYVFGGLDVILIGDMHQFRPVAPGLKYSALYQAAVAQALGKKLPNRSFHDGTTLFTKFRMLILDGQVRASPRFDKWLGRLRNLEVDYPVTDDWLSELTLLSDEDFKNKEIDWSTTGIVVAGNMERRAFIKEHVKTFSRTYNEPILQWTCPVRTTKTGTRINWGQLECDPTNLYDDLVRYFVRGAKCVLTDKVNTKAGLAKGTEGIYIDAVWKDQNINIDELPKGEVTKVSQPDFIVVKVGDAFIPIRRAKSSEEFKDLHGKWRQYLPLGCDLAAAITFHKMQGKTTQSTILSLNSNTNVSKKIAPVSIASLYVGCSRVHDHNQLRILPITQADKERLKSLQWDSSLKKFFQNYDEKGRWITDGFKNERKKEIEEVTQQLASIELDALSRTEAQHFAKKLDIIVPSTKSNPRVFEYRNALSKAHAQGLALLRKNDGVLLKKQRKLTLNELRVRNVSGLPITDLRYFAKRLGVSGCLSKSKSQLQDLLQKMLKNDSDSDDNKHGKEEMDCDSE